MIAENKLPENKLCSLMFIILSNNCVFKGLAEAKTSLGDEDVRSTAVNLVMVSCNIL